jgi:peptide/nickel transport system substrate-binding protein
VNFRARGARTALWTLPVLMLSLAGCGLHASQDTPGTLNFLIESSPVNLDPRFAGDAQSQNFDGLIFSSLVTHDAQMQIVPDLAASWDTPNPVTYVFHLRGGVKFHDGRALSSADVKYTFDSILNGIPAGGTTVRSPKRGSFGTIASVDAPDAATVVFHLREPHAAFLWEMARPAVGIVPQGAGLEVKRQPVGTGPFRFVSSMQDEEIVLERNPDYFAKAASDATAAGADGKLVERIRFRIVPEAIVRALELRKGSADIGGVSSLPADTVVVLKDKAGLAVEDDPGTAFTYIAFNFSDPILAHREVRQALAYATDRASIVQYLLRGQARLATTPLPPNHWAFDPTVKRYSYDPDEANRLLDAAGFPRGADGVRMHLALKSSTEEYTRLLTEALADQWKRVGVALELRPLETATLLSDVTHGSFQLYTLRWLGANNDPSFFDFVFSSAKMPPEGANRGHYSNPQVDALIAQENVEADRAKEKVLAGQIQQIVAEDEPYVNLWFNDTVCVHSTRVTGVNLSPTGDYNFLENVRLR